MTRLFIHNYLEHIYENNSVALIGYRQEGIIITAQIVLDNVQTEVYIDLLELMAYNHLLIIS